MRDDRMYEPAHRGNHTWKQSMGRDAFYCSVPHCQTVVSALDFLRLRDHEFASLAGVKEPSGV